MSSDYIKIRIKDAIFLVAVIESFKNVVDLKTRNKVSRIMQHIKSEIEKEEAKDGK